MSNFVRILTKEPNANSKLDPKTVSNVLLHSLNKEKIAE